MFFYSFHFFYSIPAAVLVVGSQPRNDNTNCTYTYTRTLYKERENVLYERDVVNTSRRHVLLANFLRVLGFSSASFRHSHTVSF